MQPASKKTQPVALLITVFDVASSHKQVQLAKKLHWWQPEFTLICGSVARRKLIILAFGLGGLTLLCVLVYISQLLNLCKTLRPPISGIHRIYINVKNLLFYNNV